MANIENLEQTAEALEGLGYDVNHNEEAVHIAIGWTNTPFTAVLTINDSNEVVINCSVAKLGDLNEDDVPTVQFALLDANTRIRPYAFGIISGSDNPDMNDAEQFPIVLTDSIPLGDLSTGELNSAMDSLLVAIESADEVLRIGLKA